MATSGNTIYQLTRNEIIESSLGCLSVLAQGQTPSSEDYTIGARLLNTTIARFRTLGLNLWTRQEYSWTPTTNTYLIGDGQTLDTPYPLHLLQAFRTSSGGAQVPIDIESNYDFNIYPSGSSGSIPYKINYTPYVNYGKIQFWPTELTDNDEEVTIIYTRPIEYFDSSTNTMDIPEEWYDAIIYDLAVKLAPRWGVPLSDRQLLRKEAKEYLEQAMDHGFEDGSITFAPYRR